MPVIKVYTSMDFVENLSAERRWALGEEWRTALVKGIGEPPEKIAVYWTPFFDALDPLPVELHIEYEAQESVALYTIHEFGKAIEATEHLHLIEVGVWPLFGGKPFKVFRAGISRKKP